MDFKSKIAEIVDFVPSGFIGYSANEIDKMESFYDIKISGGLRDFFLQMGRSSGNVLLGYPGGYRIECGIIPYMGYYTEKTAADVSGHFAEQYYVGTELESCARPFHTGSPFEFAIVNQTQYYFLRTRADEPLVGLLPDDDCSQLLSDPEVVYALDTNTDEVYVVNLSFRDYVLSMVQPEPHPNPGRGRGEMIAFSNYELSEIS